MAIATPPVRLPAGDIIATDVSEWDYLQHYAADHCEYVDGMVIKMSPVRDKHDALFQYLIIFLGAYLEFRSIGQLRVEPFVMELAPNIKREPDLMVILEDNPGELASTMMRGAADLCVEIVSPGSVERDYHDKYLEYQQYGVREYWLLDYQRREARFHQLDDKGEYKVVLPDADGSYRSVVLSDLMLHVPTLWLETLPGPAAIVSAMQQLLTKAK